MRFVLVFQTAVALLTACGKNKGSVVPLPSGHPQLHEATRIVEKNADADSVSQRRTGPQPLLLGPEALKDVYSAVFGNTPRAGITDPSFFTLAERDDLGGFRLIKPAVPSGTQLPADPATVRMTKLTSEYLFTLRKFSAAACKKLIDAEVSVVSNQANKLVEGEDPSLAKIDSFLSTLLGYKSKSGVHAGVKEYKEAFKKMLVAAPEPKTAAEKTNRLKASYTHLCVALSSDARVYIR